jgi:hypothetical protein
MNALDAYHHYSTAILFWRDEFGEMELNDAKLTRLSTGK